MPRAVLMVEGSGFSTSASAGRRAARWVALPTLWLVAACGSGTPPPHGPEAHLAIYTGALDGTDAKIAVVRDSAEWAAYVCGGPSTLTSITTWFQGESPRAADGEATATADGRDLSATFTEDEVSGTLAFADDTASFTAIRATRGSPAGLFQDHSNGCRAGLIVPDTGTSDAQGVYCKDFTATGKPTLRIFEQVTPVVPIDLRDGFVKARVVDSNNLVIRLTPILLPLDST